MEKELERAHNGNTRKELIIAEMKLKVDGLRMEEANMRAKIHKTSELIKSFNHDFYHLTQLIQEPRALKDAVKELNKKYGTHNVKIVPVDQDLKKELTRHREYLERNVEGLQRKLAKDTAAYHKSHLVIMQENVILINELNELRRELKVMKLNAHRGSKFKSEDSANMAKEIEAMRARISEMQLQMVRKQDEVKQLETMLSSREDDTERGMVASKKPRDVVESRVPQSSNTFKLGEALNTDPEKSSGQSGADTFLEQSATLKENDEVCGVAQAHDGVVQNNEVNLQEPANTRMPTLAESVEATAAAEPESQNTVPQEVPLPFPSSKEIYLSGETRNGIIPEHHSVAKSSVALQADTLPPRASIKDTHKSMVQGSDTSQLSAEDAHKIIVLIHPSGETSNDVEGIFHEDHGITESSLTLQPDTLPPKHLVKETHKSVVQSSDTLQSSSELDSAAQRTSVKDVPSSVIQTTDPAPY